MREAGDGREALRAAAAAKPDVVLMDIRMPELDGIEATRQLLAPAGRPPGCSCSPPSTWKPELARAVRVVAAGDALLAPAITRRLVEQFTRRPPPGSERPQQLEELTSRELDVLRLIAGGLCS